jgi:pimeloyl-ACP methyl ester carboxylesterase
MNLVSAGRRSWGQLLGGGVALQFIYQHRDYCDRLVLISSGGLGPDLRWVLRLLSAPGVELVLPVVAPQPVLNIGNKLGSWLSSAGIHSPYTGEIWSAYSSLSDGQTRQAFLRTLRLVVDYRGQAISAISGRGGLRLCSLSVGASLDSVDVFPLLGLVPRRAAAKVWRPFATPLRPLAVRIDDLHLLIRRGTNGYVV